MSDQVGNKNVGFLMTRLKLYAANLFPEPKWAGSKKCHICIILITEFLGGRTGLMVRAPDSGSGDPGSILGRVGVFVSLSKRHLLPKKYW